ncbi:hypothetical protein BDN71DRAFT_1427977 [Pleurotus eryngii]|uniref:Uncharacterized protein n=1 Tax=Pleurotus eryngii TaxID=5323 RepID=A0A9P6A8D9_PLEER|nr:hypothetical protein BDN71DRAFT_1427977 [Pleurotus eryngii]
MQLKVNNTLFILSVVGVVAIPLQSRAPVGIIEGAASGAIGLSGSTAGSAAQAGENIGSGGLNDAGGVASNAADGAVVCAVEGADSISTLTLSFTTNVFPKQRSLEADVDRFPANVNPEEGTIICVSWKFERYDINHLRGFA